MGMDPAVSAGLWALLALAGVYVAFVRPWLERRRQANLPGAKPGTAARLAEAFAGPNSSDADAKLRRLADARARMEGNYREALSSKDAEEQLRAEKLAAAARRKRLEDEARKRGENPNGDEEVKKPILRPYRGPKKGSDLRTSEFNPLAGSGSGTSYRPEKKTHGGGAS
jgi:hypothetical protein